MSAAPITGLDVVRARAPVQTGPADDGPLSDVILSASEAIEQELGRALTEADFTEVFDGDRRPVGEYRESLYVRNPPIRAVAPWPIITENGTALVVGGTYDATGATQVYVEPEMGLLTRIGGWLPGQRNISVTYRGAVGLPAQDLVSVCVELTWLTWRLAAKDSGLSGANLPGASFQALRDLSAVSRATLNRYRLWIRP